MNFMSADLTCTYIHVGVYPTPPPSRDSALDCSCDHQEEGGVTGERSAKYIAIMGYLVNCRIEFSAHLLAVGYTPHPIDHP